jgi:hypothetical protein
LGAGVFPSGRARLGVEVYDNSRLVIFLGRDGEMQRESGFPGAAFLAEDRYGVHLVSRRCWQLGNELCLIAGNCFAMGACYKVGD